MNFPDDAEDGTMKMTEVRDAQGTVAGSQCMRGSVSSSHVSSTKHVPPLALVRSCGLFPTIFSGRSDRLRRLRSFTLCCTPLLLGAAKATGSG